MTDKQAAITIVQSMLDSLDHAIVNAVKENDMEKVVKLQNMSAREFLEKTIANLME